MPAVFVNTATVLIGALVGIALRAQLKELMQKTLMKVLGLCTAVIGMASAIQTNAVLCVVICMVLGTALGTVLRMDQNVSKLGEAVQQKLSRNGTANSSFAEGFLSACILFCIGPMTIIGCMEAGINHVYSILLTKSAMDFVSSIAMGAALGFGVAFSSVFVLVFEGMITLLAALVGPALSAEVITEMSAIGGTILTGMACNMLNLGKERIKVADMLPAIFLPIAYFPVYRLLSGWFA